MLDISLKCASFTTSRGHMKKFLQDNITSLEEQHCKFIMKKRILQV